MTTRRKQKEKHEEEGEEDRALLFLVAASRGERALPRRRVFFFPFFVHTLLFFSLRLPSSLLFSPLLLSLFSPQSRGGRRVHQPHELLDRHLARVRPHGVGPLALHLLPRQRRADPEHAHARRARGRDARRRVLDHDAVSRVRAEGGGRGQEGVGRRLEPLEGVGGDDGVEVVGPGHEADGVEARVDLDQVRRGGDGGPEAGRAAGGDERPRARGRDAVAAPFLPQRGQVLGEEERLELGDVRLGDPALLGDAGEEVGLPGPDKGDKLLRGDAVVMGGVVGEREREGERGEKKRESEGERGAKGASKKRKKEKKGAKKNFSKLTPRSRRASA